MASSNPRSSEEALADLRESLRLVYEGGSRCVDVILTTLRTLPGQVLISVADDLPRAAHAAQMDTRRVQRISHHVTRFRRFYPRPPQWVPQSPAEIDQGEGESPAEIDQDKATGNFAPASVGRSELTASSKGTDPAASSGSTATHSASTSASTLSKGADPVPSSSSPSDRPASGSSSTPSKGADLAPSSATSASGPASTTTSSASKGADLAASSGSIATHSASTSSSNSASTSLQSATGTNIAASSAPSAELSSAKDPMSTADAVSSAGLGHSAPLDQAPRLATPGSATPPCPNSTAGYGPSTPAAPNPAPAATAQAISSPATDLNPLSTSLMQIDKAPATPVGASSSDAMRVDSDPSGAGADSAADAAAAHTPAAAIVKPSSDAMQVDKSLSTNGGDTTDTAATDGGTPADAMQIDHAPPTSQGPETNDQNTAASDIQPKSDGSSISRGSDDTTAPARSAGDAIGAGVLSFTDRSIQLQSKRARPESFIDPPPRSLSSEELKAYYMAQSQAAQAESSSSTKPTSGAASGAQTANTDVQVDSQEGRVTRSGARTGGSPTTSGSKRVGSYRPSNEDDKRRKTNTSKTSSSSHNASQAQTGLAGSGASSSTSVEATAAARSKAQGAAGNASSDADAAKQTGTGKTTSASKAQADKTTSASKAQADAAGSSAGSSASKSKAQGAAGNASSKADAAKQTETGKTTSASKAQANAAGSGAGSSASKSKAQGAAGNASSKADAAKQTDTGKTTSASKAQGNAAGSGAGSKPSAKTASGKVQSSTPSTGALSRANETSNKSKCMDPASTLNEEAGTSTASDNRAGLGAADDTENSSIVNQEASMTVAARAAAKGKRRIKESVQIPKGQPIPLHLIVSRTPDLCGLPWPWVRALKIVLEISQLGPAGPERISDHAFMRLLPLQLTDEYAKGPTQLQADPILAAAQVYDRSHYLTSSRVLQELFDACHFAVVYRQAHIDSGSIQSAENRMAAYLQSQGRDLSPVSAFGDHSLGKSKRPTSLIQKIKTISTAGTKLLALASIMG
ncbi:hypothetical protein OC842_006681, partial [Tilletia horrida]